MQAIKYLALGDSYTIGTAVTADESYPMQVQQWLSAHGVAVAKTEIIATNGWTTADLLKATDGLELPGHFDVVSLLIGVNNQYQRRSQQEYQQQFTTLLQRAIRLAGDRPGRVIVLSIPDYSVTPFAKDRDTAGIAKEIDAFNAINKNIAKAHQVRYLDVTPDSRKAAADKGLLASDGLHFSGKEYGLWTAALAPMIKAALQ